MRAREEIIESGSRRLAKLDSKAEGIKEKIRHNGCVDCYSCRLFSMYGKKHDECPEHRDW